MEKYVLYGIIPSKKNSKRIVMAGKYPKLLPSLAYEKWHPEALERILMQKQGEVIIKCDKIEIEFLHKFKRKWDLSNKAESVMDLLVDAEIIEDDNYSVVPELILKYTEAKENKTIIKIS